MRKSQPSDISIRIKLDVNKCRVEEVSTSRHLDMQKSRFEDLSIRKSPNVNSYQVKDISGWGCIHLDGHQSDELLS